MYVVGDIDHTSAVIQVVTKEGDTIYRSLVRSCPNFFSMPLANYLSPRPDSC